MIIPTPQYDPMFANDGVPFRDKMIDYIAREFSDTLGSHIAALQSPRGLDSLSAIYVGGATDSSSERKAA